MSVMPKPQGYRVDLYLTSGPTLFAFTKKKDQAEKIVETWRNNRHKDEIIKFGNVESRTDHIIAATIQEVYVQKDTKGKSEKTQKSA